MIIKSQIKYPDNPQTVVHITGDYLKTMKMPFLHNVC